IPIVGANAGDAQVAMCTADGSRNHRLRRRAGRDSRRYQGWRNRLQTGHIRVTVLRLEQVGTAVAGVTSFKGGVLGYFAFETEVPGIYLVRSKVFGHRRVIKLARIEDPRRQERLVGIPHGRTVRRRWQWLGRG